MKKYQPYYQLSGLNGLAGLGDVAPDIAELIDSQPDNVESIIASLEKEARKSADKFTFDDNDALYNMGITDNQKRAWVYYKRKYLGIPMNGGWSKYYLKGGLSSIDPYGTKEELDELVRDGAMFYSDGQYLPLPVFAWGNMYERMRTLESDREYIIAQYGADIYSNHYEVVQKAKPKQITIDDPVVSKRAVIVPRSVTARTFMIKEVAPEYMKDVSGATQIDFKGKRVSKAKRIDLVFDEVTKYSLQHVFIKWLYTLDQKRNFTPGISPYEVVTFYVQGGGISSSYLEQKSLSKQEVEQYSREDGDRLFNKFLAEVLTDEDKQRLNDVFNEKYNGWSELNFNAIPIGLETSSTFLGHGFAIRPEKRDAIAYMEAVGSGILAYDVGVGKTVSALLELSNAMYQGKCKRPLVVVPNPTYKNWIKEAFGGEDNETGETFNGLLSGLGYKYRDWYNLNTVMIKALDQTGELDEPVPEGTVTFMSYEGFMKLGFSSQVGNEFVNEMSQILDQEIVDPVISGNSNSGLGDVEGKKSKTQRQKDKQKREYREMIGIGRKDSVVDIDVLGYDYIIIDEAHRCKNVFSGVKSDDEGKKNYHLSGGTPSITGLKAFFFTNYIQRKFGRNVMLLTATPFTNSPLEVYSMISLVGYDMLVKSGYYNINDFFAQFAKVSSEYVVNTEGKVSMKEVIKGFNNRLILQKLIFTKVNYKTGEDVGVQRPCKINLPMLASKSTKEQLDGMGGHNDQILTYLEMNEVQRENQEIIVNALNNAMNSGGKPDLGMFFSAMSESLNNALSPYFFGINPDSRFHAYSKVAANYKEFVEGSPKVKYVCECIRTVKSYHERKKEDVSGQVIYANRGVNYFYMIKQYLIKEVGFKSTVDFDGHKLSEVMIIAGGKDNKEKVDKEIIKEAFNAGVVKVIIGSATIREGINLQKRGTCLYNMYPDWNPTDVRQLEGRIWRQGNRFGYVRMVMPLVQGSMDVFVFQKLEEKTSRINDLFFREGATNVLDLDSIDPGQIKYALIKDINELVKIDFALEESRAYTNLEIVQEDAESIKRLNTYIGNMEKNKIDAITKLRDSALPSMKRYLRDYGDKDDIQYDKDKVTYVKRLHDDIQAWLVQANDLDQLMRFAPRIDRFNQRVGYTYTIWDTKYAVNDVSNSIREVRKLEREVLKPKGYSLNDNIEKITTEINDSFTKLKRDYLTMYGKPSVSDDGETKYQQIHQEKDYRFANRYKELYDEVVAKKAALNIEGMSWEERVEDFAGLNYLLDYKMGDVDPASCFIPEKGKPAKSNKTAEQVIKEIEDTDELELAKSIAIAVQAQLELLELELELEFEPALAGTHPTTVNTRSKISRKDYPGIFEDYDGDGVLNADDPNPLTPGDTKQIEEVLLSDEIGKLIDLRSKLEDVRGKLIRKVSTIGDGKVKSRSKTPFSMVNKMIRKRLLGSKGLTDLVGAMMIVEDEQQINEALRKIKRGSIGKIIEHEDFYERPLNGYRAHHFIIEVDELPVELQLKTRRMKAISESSHTPYKQGKLNSDEMEYLTTLAMKADAGHRQSAEKLDKLLADPVALQNRLTD